MKRIIVLIAILFLISTSLALAKHKKLTKDLGWVRDCAGGNLCCGYYFEPDDIVTNPHPGSLNAAPINVTATEPVIFTKKNASVLKGNVVMLQPGREITADRVIFFRDEHTGKVSRSLFYGNVNFREYGKLIVAEQGNLDFVNKIYSFNNGAYRLLADTPTGLANVWGQARRAIVDESGVLKLTRATYTSCSPDAASWYIWGSKTNLDRNIGRGSVTNGILFFKRIPVFYFPYYHFPIDKRRISGFLAPTLNYSSNGNGFYRASLPYYLNLAPNYDALLTPEYYSQRGVLFQGLFKYLTPTSTGSVNFGYICNDQKFIEFRDTSPTKSPQYNWVLQSLKDSSANRGSLNFRHNSIFSEHWRGILDVNYVTDDYFVENFPDAVPISTIDSDQLLNQAYIDYSGENWNFFGQLQMFQTLHRITSPGVLDQYKKIPHIGVSGDFSDGFAGLDYELDSEIVNFIYHNNRRQLESTPIVSGVRFNFMPSISAPLNIDDWYLIPRCSLQTTGYSLYDAPKRNAPNDIMRFHTFLSVDGGTVLSRNLSFFHRQYNQTLEPRIFYLFVPYADQDAVPIFDTFPASLGYDQSFLLNRFSGLSRVGDANQIVMAITTRFLNNYGQERINTSLSQIFSMHKHQVYINPNDYDPLRTHNLSPLFGKIQFHLDSRINSSFDFAWDQYLHRFSVIGANINYNYGVGRFVSCGYNYVINNDMFNETVVSLQRINASFGWRVWRHWNILGDLYYNVSSKRAESYLYGLEYNGCCWAFRIMHNNTFVGVGTDTKAKYDSTYTLQLVLKGAGSYLNTFSSKKRSALYRQFPGLR
jgi:LPS-assembly protein